MVWVTLGIGGPDVVQGVVDLTLVALPAFAGIAALLASRAQESAGSRRAWALLGAACVSWAAGGAVWAYYELVLGVDVPFPSAADVGYLAFIPLAAAALVLLPGAPDRAAGRGRVLLDGLTLACSVLIVSWAFVLGPAYRAESASVLSKAIGLAYPAGDVVLATVALFAIHRSAGAARETSFLLCLGLLALAVADSAFAVLTLQGGYATGTLVDAGWVFGFLLVSAAAIRGGRTPTPGTAPSRASNRYSSLVPVVTVLAPVGIVLFLYLRDRAIEPVLLGLAFLLFVVILVRQVLAIDELHGAHSRLRDLERARVLLFNSVVHDVGAPLTTIALQARMLSHESAPPERSIGILRRNVDRLERLMGDIRDLGHLEDGRLAILPAPVSVVPAVAEVVEGFHAAAERARIRLDFAPGRDATVLADPGRFHQVVANLVGNAVKFTPKGGTVRIEAGADTTVALVRVSDTGPGLSRDQMARLFRPFSRVHERGPDGPPGSGLGLYIAQGIVERHGGRIRAESDGPGRGATFTIELPLVPQPVQRRA
ncbi:MAG: sensor histidine kinase [Methanobacteriota archaeon]